MFRYIRDDNRAFPSFYYLPLKSFKEEMYSLRTSSFRMYLRLRPSFSGNSSSASTSCFKWCETEGCVRSRISCTSAQYRQSFLFLNCCKIVILLASLNALEIFSIFLLSIISAQRYQKYQYIEMFLCIFLKSIHPSVLKLSTGFAIDAFNDLYPTDSQAMTMEIHIASRYNTGPGLK